MVYAKIWGANRVYYGELENREYNGKMTKNGKKEIQAGCWM